MASLGKVRIKADSQTKGEICLRLTCNETKDAIKNAYSLIKDLQSYFEFSLY